MNSDTLICLLCGYTWEPRGTDLPKCCPRCKRYDWNKVKPGGFDTQTMIGEPDEVK
jgi:predicted Zn-ribbon and HTH transcriptional regulator